VNGLSLGHSAPRGRVGIHVDAVSLERRRDRAHVSPRAADLCPGLRLNEVGQRDRRQDRDDRHDDQQLDQSESSRTQCVTPPVGWRFLHLFYRTMGPPKKLAGKKVGRKKSVGPRGLGVWPAPLIRGEAVESRVGAIGDVAVTDGPIR
jgi:hypothetical protein